MGQDVEKFMVEMDEYTGLFTPAFESIKQMGWSQAYLWGLLGTLKFPMGWMAFLQI
jgi:hypothetical protein